MYNESKFHLQPPGKKIKLETAKNEKASAAGICNYHVHV